MAYVLWKASSFFFFYFNSNMEKGLNIIPVEGILRVSHLINSGSGICFVCLVAKSCQTLWPHGLHHASLPCPSPSPRVCSNSCPLGQWCHPTILSSVIPLSCLQSFPSSGSFWMSRIFVSGSQTIGASASASVLPMNIQNRFPLGLTSWISLQSKGLSRVFLSTTVQKHQFFSAQPSLWSNSHIHTWLLEKP